MSYTTALNYTSGNWTITSLTTDTIATAKTLSIKDLDYTNDFAVTQDEPLEARLSNITGSSLISAENLRYAKSAVSNVYTGTEVGASNQMPVKTGIRTLVEANVLVKAVNSVSGEEYMLPIRAWTIVQVPNASFVSNAVLEYALGRALGALFNTGATTIGRVEEVARGSLLPD